MSSAGSWRGTSPREKSLEKYLHEHPKADPHKHHVTDHEDKGHGEGGGHGEGKGHDDAGGHAEHGHGTMFSRLKGALKTVAKKFADAPKDVQKFIGDAEHRKATLKKGVKELKGAPAKYGKQLVQTAKHEVKEFKTAGQGIAAVVKGGKATAEQKHAMKQVAIHMGITIAAAVLTTASPGLAAMAAGKALGKHVALKAATEVLGDLHVLEEMGHVGHGIHHVLKHVLHHVRLAEEGKEEAAEPEEIFAALVMKHIAEQIQKLDDDSLAEGLGGDDDEDDGQDKQAFRVACLYVAAQPV